MVWFGLVASLLAIYSNVCFLLSRAFITSLQIIMMIFSIIFLLLFANSFFVKPKP